MSFLLKTFVRIIFDVLAYWLLLSNLSLLARLRIANNDGVI